MKSLNKMKNTWKRFLYKALFDRFSIGRKLASIDWKLNSINQASIEHQLSQAYCNLNFYHIFDWSRDKFDQSKILKTQIFEKQRNLMQKLLKAQCFMNEMQEYEIKSFSKTLEFNPDLPKNKFFNQFVLKNSNIKHILH